MKKAIMKKTIMKKGIISIEGMKKILHPLRRKERGAVHHPVRNGRSFCRLLAFAAAVMLLVSVAACGGKTEKTGTRVKAVPTEETVFTLHLPPSAPEDTAGTTAATLSSATEEGTDTSVTRASSRRKTRRTTATQPTDVPEEPAVTQPVRYEGDLGSARSLDGTTVIFSIYASDSTTRWDPDSQTDRDMIRDTHDNLWRAVTYLGEQVGQYGKTADFVWNWEEDADLRYDAAFEESLVTPYGDMYSVQREWVLSHIDTETVRAKYDAQNVVYLFFFNTDFSNQVNPWTLGHSNCSDYDVEFCNLYVRFDDAYVTPPSTYAHEMMHCFGAHDLYYANEFIPQRYVDHCAASGSNDIMYTVVDGKWITNDFTELDAYYTGLIDSCEEAETWNLAQSEHVA